MAFDRRNGSLSTLVEWPAVSVPSRHLPERGIGNSNAPGAPPLMDDATVPYRDTVKAALVHLDVGQQIERVVDAIRATPGGTGHSSERRPA